MNALQNLLSLHEAQLTLLTVLIFIILGVVIAFYKMMKGSMALRIRFEDANKANFGAGITLTVKESADEPLVLKLDQDAIERARDLLRSGSDLESVCREIEPAYANWMVVQQKAFQRVLEMVLKS